MFRQSSITLPTEVWVPLAFRAAIVAPQLLRTPPTDIGKYNDITAGLSLLCIRATAYIKYRGIDFRSIQTDFAGEELKLNLCNAGLNYSCTNWLKDHPMNLPIKMKRSDTKQSTAKNKSLLNNVPENHQS